MVYVAIKGGEAAIEQSLKLLDIVYKSNEKIEVKSILANMPLLIDKIMSEAGLYAPEYAALALKQSKGSVEEAVFLLRAYRSTLRRDYYSLPADCKNMRIMRRISAVFKDIPGGQILGASFDYAHRLLNFDLLDENAESADVLENQELEDDIYCDRIDDLLHADGVLEKYPEDNTLP